MCVSPGVLMIDTHNWLYWSPGLVAVALLLAELGLGHFRRQRMPGNDKLLNLVSFLQDSTITRPLVALVTAAGMSLLCPEGRGRLAELPLWPTFILFVLGQDLVHYWFHRMAHEWQWLWNIHRTHHSARSMSVVMTPRLNVLWELLLPVNYTAGVAIYLGLGQVYLMWWALRAVLNFVTHSSLRWDLPLYEIRWLQPAIWLTERLFTTVDAHHGHHSTEYPACNFAPVVILWDFIFGTARLHHARPAEIGIADEPDYAWYRQLWWPLMPLRESNGTNNEGFLEKGSASR